MRKTYLGLVLLLGIISIAFQILLIRETSAAFSGNELIFGLVLSIWMILSSLGYRAARVIKIRAQHVKWLFVGVAILPWLTVFAIRMLTGLIFLRGSLVSPTPMFFFLFLAMLPFCFLNGFFIVAVSPLYSKSTERIVLFDTIGDMLGGMLFSFMFVYLFGTFQLLLILFVAGMLAASYVAIREHNYTLGVGIGLVILIGIVLSLFFNPEQLSLSTQFHGQDILETRFTPYGNIVLSKTGEQLNLFENGNLITHSGNFVEAEQVVHYAMLQHPNPKGVLLISGGTVLNEILKYNVSVDYVEIDPEIVRLEEIYFSLPKSVNCKLEDGRRYLRNTNKKYDVIIVDLPEPDSAQLNRFYTEEFFGLVKSRLNPNGVLGFHLAGGENYLSPNQAELHSVIIAGAKRHFSHAIAIPGETVYYVLSDGPLSYNYKELLAGAGIKTRYVNENYLSGVLTPDRVNAFQDSIKPTATLNKDMRPVVYHYALKQWLAEFNSSLLPLFVLLALMLAWYISRPSSFPIFTTGFAGISIELILLLVFQTMYGYIYSQIGLMVGLFMLGMLAGNWPLMHRKVSKQLFFTLDISVLLYCILLGIVLVFGGFIPSIAIYFSIAVGGYLVGAEFLAAIKWKQNLGGIYYADTIGAAIGGLLTSIILIPLFGMPFAILAIAGLKLVSVIVLWKS